MIAADTSEPGGAMLYRTILISLTCFALGGCWNGENIHVSLGDVSLGQQLIDLKSALDQGAITPEEFDATKETLLSLNALCQNTEEEE
jgi:hypothetical protein